MTYDSKYSAKNEETRKKNSHRVGIDFPHEYYDNVLLPAANHAEMKVNTFIKECIKYYLENHNDTT